jgi:hypothetical protein
MTSSSCACDAASPYLVPHQQPLLHTPELRLALLQLLVGSTQRSTHSKVALNQVKHILAAAAAAAAAAEAAAAKHEA